MIKKNFLIIDLGAGSGRAIVAAFDGNRYEMEEIYRFDNRPVFLKDTIYWDFLRLFSEIKIAITIAVKKYKKIQSMAVDTWGVDFGCIDRKGILIANPVNYRDEKRAKMSSDILEIISKEELFSLTGGMIIPIMSIFQLYYFIKNNALEIKNCSSILMIPDLINYFLTGNIANEYTNATTTLLVNQKNGQWEKKIFDAIGLDPSFLQNLSKPGTLLGKLSRTLCKELDIKPFDVVLPATHDSASAVCGIPAKKINENNWAFITIGTWCAAGCETKLPIVSKELFLSGNANIGGVENTNIVTKNITGLWIIQQCMERWRNVASRDISWIEIDQLYAQAKAFKTFIDVDDPVFSAPSSNMEKVIKAYCKKHHLEVPESIADVSRCFYESLAFKFKYNMEELQKVTHRKFNRIHLLGGGSKNKNLCQWIADLSDTEVLAGPTETTAAGNLLMQLKASKEILSLEDGRQCVGKSSPIEHFEPSRAAHIMWMEKYKKFKDFFKLS